jgi:hypothetical protein
MHKRCLEQQNLLGTRNDKPNLDLALSMDIPSISIDYTQYDERSAIKDDGCWVVGCRYLIGHLEQWVNRNYDGRLHRCVGS